MVQHDIIRYLATLSGELSDRITVGGPKLHTVRVVLPVADSILNLFAARPFPIFSRNSVHVSIVYTSDALRT